MGAKPNTDRAATRVTSKAKWLPILGAVGGAIVLGVGLSLGLGVPKSPLQPTRFNPLSPPSPEAEAAASPLPKPSPSEQPIASGSPDPVAAAKRQGTLRISNPTEYPVRVALLSKSPAAPKPEFDIPAHWDFAPQEGGDRGLIVSLPDRSIKLKQGDVLVAFAQDGSRRYWGPYVVGETPIPVWNPKLAEWQLTLQP